MLRLVKLDKYEVGKQPETQVMETEIKFLGFIYVYSGSWDVGWAGYSSDKY